VDDAPSPRNERIGYEASVTPGGELLCAHDCGCCFPGKALEFCDSMLENRRVHERLVAAGAITAEVIAEPDIVYSCGTQRKTECFLRILGVLPGSGEASNVGNCPDGITLR
jgi:hypothetical protein